MLLLKLLDPNPRRRLPLSDLLGLLECDDLWAAASTTSGNLGDTQVANTSDDQGTSSSISNDLGELPEPVRRFFAGMQERVMSPADASRGMWWPSNPWWMAPPSVSLIPELR